MESSRPFLSKPVNALLYLQRSGIGSFFRELVYRCYNKLYERRLRIETSGITTLQEVGVAKNDLFDYMPLGYYAIWSALKMLPVNKEECTFIDFGCGKGRAVAAAATYPFRRVIGIDLSEQLIAAAENNIKRLQHKRANRIDLYNIDATKYVLPDEVNVVYFFNPFQGEVLQTVIKNIYASLLRSPRQIYIIYFNKIHFERIVTECNWIVRLSEQEYYPRYSCGIFVTKT